VPQGTFGSTIVIAVTDNISDNTLVLADQKACAGVYFKQGTELQGTTTEFNAFGVISGKPSCGQSLNNNFLKPMTLYISYRDLPVSVSLENYLRICYLDASSKEWKLLPGEQVIDSSERTVSALITHFSFYRLFAVTVASQDLRGVIAYPNPIKGTGYTLKFAGLTSQATIWIYNIAGELVRTIDEADGDGMSEWDLRNGGGEQVASGVYLYLVTNPSGQKATGKVAVIR